MYTQKDFSRDITACLVSGGFAPEVFSHMGRIILQAQEFLTADEIQSCLDKVECSPDAAASMVKRVKDNLRVRQQWYKGKNMARERGLLALFGDLGDEETFGPPPFFSAEE